MTFIVRFFRPESCPNEVVPEVSSKIWNSSLLLSYRLAYIILRKIELLNLKAAYTTTITCEKANYRAFWEILVGFKKINTYSFNRCHIFFRTDY